MWKSININKQNIKAETEKAVLIACPHNSRYDGYQFWHPAKLVRDGRHKNAVSISYTEDFSFRLKKYGKGKHNKNQVVVEDELGYEDIEEIFGVMNNFVDKYETYKPEQLEAENVEVLEELKDE